MKKNNIYIHVEQNQFNKDIVNEILDYSMTNSLEQLYIINTPLSDSYKYSYQYQESAIIVLSPGYKIMFIDLEGDDEKFDEYYEDFIEDLNSISDKFNYRGHIGRPREWRENNTIQIYNENIKNIKQLLNENKLEDPKIKRISELLISLLIGSINDIDKVGAIVPDTLLEKVKKNILLFDGEQTRFIYKEFNKKSVSIQGLSGTGKTELLLHKLKELYMLDDKSRIYFTCHNIALANNLKDRIPSFFNFMKVEKQIEWNKRLWVSHAWGSKGDPNTGFYSYLCAFYNIPFLRWSPENDYEKIFGQVLDAVNEIDEDSFKYAFDFILIDERQDFPSIFFQLCEKIANKKIYIAGDIFQDIFEKAEQAEIEVDIVLNRCYRTDPRTLMFAHGIGLGLFERKKLNWFSDSYWNDIGYEVERADNRIIRLYREPVRRFEELKIEDFESVIIECSTKPSKVIDIIMSLQNTHNNLKPDDVAIIIMEKNRANVYSYIDTLSSAIERELGWSVNRAYENKNKIPDSVFISNPNNVKGLEFPFVICISASIKDSYKDRNILYTMLTRSFIQSYLLVSEEQGIAKNREGLKIINEQNCIQTTEPTPKERAEIESKLSKFIQKNESISYDDFIIQIFDDLEIAHNKRGKLKNALLSAEFDKFDKKMTIKFIKANQEFYN